MKKNEKNTERKKCSDYSSSSYNSGDIGGGSDSDSDDDLITIRSESIMKDIYKIIKNSEIYKLAETKNGDSYRELSLESRIYEKIY